MENINDFICKDCQKSFRSSCGLFNHSRFGCSTLRFLTFKRNCPICGDSIQYECPSKLKSAIKNNSKCKKCLLLNPNMSGAHSQAAREKMAKTRTGVKLSEEHKQKIGISVKNSEKHKISCQSEERRQKLSLANKGKVFSAETKRKMSENSNEIDLIQKIKKIER